MKDYTSPIAAFRVRPDLKERIDKLAKDTRRSASFYYQIILEENIDALERRFAPTDKIDTSRTYTAEEVQAMLRFINDNKVQ